MSNKEKTVTRSGGNIFADLGLPDADEHLLKARVAVFIAAVIKQRALTQTAAGRVMGIEQPDVSKLLSGRIEGFSLARLLSFARSLGSDVEIKVKSPNKGGVREGRMSLRVA
jgi:predicted XRE-type DNA-binding protein